MTRSQDNVGSISDRGAVLSRTAAKETIALGGICVDVLHQTASEGHSAHLLETPDSTNWREWEKLATEEWDLRHCTSKLERRDTFWRTLVANHRSSTELATANLGQQFEDWWNEEDGDQTEWRSMLRYTINPSSRLFVTKRGYLSLTCEHALPSDKVCMLWGGQFFFLLRERKPQLAGDAGDEPTKYSLVGGDTYVHGLVNGVGLSMLRAEGISEETYVLV
jgi:hypothetical protein